MTEEPNLEYIKKLAGDDIAFENQFIEIIKTEFPDEVIDYNSAIENKQLLVAAEIVHKLKHKLNILSMEKSYEIALAYEDQLREDSMKLDKEFRTILDIISNYLTTI